MTQTQEGIGIGGLLEVFIGLGHKLDREHEWRVKHSDIVTQVPVLAQITGNGTADTGRPQMGPPAGQCWSIRWLSFTGYSAGQVAVNINALEPFLPFIPPPSATFPGMLNWGRGGFLLMPGDRITATSTGITGNVLVAGRADLFPEFYLPTYLD